MKAFLWRMLYAVICVLMFWLVFPLFIQILGFPLTGPVAQLMHILIACIAVLYVLFGGPPPMPF